MITATDEQLSARLARLRLAMESEHVDVAMLSVGADLPYFTGYEAMPLERLTMLIVRLDDVPTLVVPELEAPRIGARPGLFEVVAWVEGDDPIRLVAACASDAETVAFGDQTWSTFLLALQDRMPAARFRDASELTRGLRMRKDAQEIDALRTVAHAADRVAGSLAEKPFAGRTELEVAADLSDGLRAEGHEVVTFTIVAGGPHAASPHHEPTTRRFESGDAVVLDFGGRLGGYCSDTTRTFWVGAPPPPVAAAHAVLQEAQQAATSAVRPGVPAEEIDRVARAIITDAGYGPEFFHRTGHGIGLEGHEHPYIIEGNGLPLEAGMAFSIEPGIYRAGEWGMRIEDIVVVTADGVESLNQSDRSLRVVA